MLGTGMKTSVQYGERTCSVWSVCVVFLYHTLLLCVTYGVARRGQGRPVRRRMERLLDFCSDNPVEGKKEEQV